MAHLSGIERVRVSADSPIADVDIDTMRVEQVVTNLISNALKYGDDHSEVVVHVTHRANDVEIAVTNRGGGISEDEMPQLFNRFMRSKSTRGSGVPGLGLGLYISKGVIQAHGGRLWAESTPGETTSFRLTLPASVGMKKAA